VAHLDELTISLPVGCETLAALLTLVDTVAAENGVSEADRERMLATARKIAVEAIAEHAEPGESGLPVHVQRRLAWRGMRTVLLRHRAPSRPAPARLPRPRPRARSVRRRGCRVKARSPGRQEPVHLAAAACLLARRVAVHVIERVLDLFKGGA
jgi:hypothetical protein